MHDGEAEPREDAWANAYSIARSDVGDPSMPTTTRGGVTPGWGSARTTTTGQRACMATWSDTDPSRAPRTAPRPRAPSTMLSAVPESSTRAGAG